LCLLEVGYMASSGKNASSSEERLDSLPID